MIYVLLNIPGLSFHDVPEWANLFSNVRNQSKAFTVIECRYFASLWKSCRTHKWSKYSKFLLGFVPITDWQAFYKQGCDRGAAKIFTYWDIP